MRLTRRKLKLTCVNLYDVGQGQADLVPIQDGVLLLDWVAFKVDGRQVLLVAKMLSDVVEVADLAVAGPQLFERREPLDALEFVDRVGRDV